MPVSFGSSNDGDCRTEHPYVRTIYHVVVRMEGLGGCDVPRGVRRVTQGDVRGRRVSDPRGLYRTWPAEQRPSAAETSRQQSGGVHGSPQSPGLAAASPRGGLAVKGSAARRNPSLPASGLRGSADGHLPWSAAARFRAVRGMHAAVVGDRNRAGRGDRSPCTDAAMAPWLPAGGSGPGPGHGRVGHRVAGLNFLVFGRLRRRTRLNELLLACALAVLALSNLFLCTVPVVAGWAPDDLTVWLAPVAMSFGALLFALAAFLPDRRLRPSGPVLVLAAGAVTAALLLTMVLVPGFTRSLPPQAVDSLARLVGRPSRIWLSSACSSRGRCCTGRPPSGPCDVSGGAVTSSSAGLP